MIENENKVIGANIAFRLECLHMTQKELGKRTGIPYPSISNYVRGLVCPSALVLVRIAQALGCTVGQLLEGVRA